MKTNLFERSLVYLGLLGFLSAGVSGLEARAGARHWVTPDFFIENGPQTSNANEKEFPNTLFSASDCRAHIKEAVCLVSPAVENPGGDPPVRECLAGGQDYAHYFEELYDNLPLPFQKMFCSLRYINIEIEFQGTAYAGLQKDSQGRNIAVMGIRKSVLDDAIDLGTWATWKEQLSFGGATDSYRKPRSDLPVILTSPHREVNTFLYFALAHEFGHLFDFANKLNARKGDGKFAPGTWGAMSWLDDTTPRPEFEFPERKKLCFYWCKDSYLGAQDADSLYDHLFSGTNFISTYAATNPYDDFADSVAYYLTDLHLGSRYVIVAGSGQAFDSMAKLHSSLLRSKYVYLQEFLNRNDIIYPE